MAVTTIVLSVFVAFFVIGQINALPTNAPGQESKDVLQAERRRSNLRELINYLLNEDKVVIEEEAIEPVYEEYSPTNKHYERLSRGRIGGTIVMGKKK